MSTYLPWIYTIFFGFPYFSFSSKGFFKGSSLMFRYSTTLLNSTPRALNFSFSLKHHSDASMGLDDPLQFSKSFSSLCLSFDCVAYNFTLLFCSNSPRVSFRCSTKLCLHSSCNEPTSSNHNSWQTHDSHSTETFRNNFVYILM